MELKGKVINFLGDSITYGDGVIDKENNRYDNIICREHNLRAVNNYGIPGTRIAYQIQPGSVSMHDLFFCGRAFMMARDADAIVVYGGVNDYLHGDAPIGCKEDRLPQTFWGGVNYLMNILRYIYPDKPIAFITPAKCFENGKLSCLEKSPNPTKREDALPLEGYVNIIKEAAQTRGIPVLDLYNDFEINPLIDEHRERYTKDGLHFNDEGHKILAKYVSEFLLKI